MNKALDPSLLPPNPYLLLTPGPLSTSPAVRAALVNDWCTWDDEYNALTREIRERLERLADPERRFLAVPLQGSGTFAVEAMIGCALPRGAKLLVLRNGAYGERAGRIARMLGIDTVEHDSGELAPPDPQAVAEILAANPDLTHVFLVHVETTTGMANPVEAIAQVVKDAGRKLLLDAMSSFGGLTFDPVALRLEAFATSANKCLQGVPGIGLVFVHKDAMPDWEGRSRSLSLDVFGQWREMEDNRGKWRFTSPTHVVHAFLAALRELESEGGIASRHARLTANQRTLVEGMRSLGFETVLPEDVGAGRPFPYMAWESAKRLGIFPLSTFVKIGDTPADMREGRNAGCWCIGYSRCGNELGLSREEDLALSCEERTMRLSAATERLRDAGAHFVVEGPWEVVAVLERIDAMVRAGRAPSSKT